MIFSSCNLSKLLATEHQTVAEEEWASFWCNLSHTLAQTGRPDTALSERVFSMAVVIGEFLGIIGSDAGVCKSDRLHVDILRFSFIKLGHIIL
jgi:hypothetical protein